MEQTMEAMRYRSDCSERTDYTNGVTARVMGEVVHLQNRIGIVTSPQGIAASAFGSLELCGVFRLIKDGTTGPVFTKDDEVYWDTVNNLAVAAPGANIVFAGLADEAAGTNEDNVKVEINKLPPQFVAGYLVTTTSTT
jgi:predicted RecA/RadA family phage recombinase